MCTQTNSLTVRPPDQTIELEVLWKLVSLTSKTLKPWLSSAESHKSLSRLDRRCAKTISISVHLQGSNHNMFLYHQHQSLIAISTTLYFECWIAFVLFWAIGNIIGSKPQIFFQALPDNQSTTSDLHRWRWWSPSKSNNSSLKCCLLSE